MSKRRHNVTYNDAEFDGPPASDLDAWVVFTQLKPEGPHLYAGWLNARDGAMALVYAREHYGQDQPCVNIWAIDRRHVIGTDLREPDDRGGERRTWVVLYQTEAGETYRNATDPGQRRVEAATSREAVDAAHALLPNAAALHGVWVVPESCIVQTSDDEVLWRETDQGYRLARGYSKDVRAKWEQVREQRALEEYEKEDLEEMFVDR